MPSTTSDSSPVVVITDVDNTSTGELPALLVERGFRLVLNRPLGGEEKTAVCAVNLTGLLAWLMCVRAVLETV